MSRLDRFLTAQDGGVFDTALAEIRSGTKRSHWMWFVFPQIAGLGRSETARFFAIADRGEAIAYLAQPVLGARLATATAAMLEWSGQRSADAILGTVDAMKFASSMTLFETVAESPAIYAAALDGFFGGRRDAETLRRL